MKYSCQILLLLTMLCQATRATSDDSGFELTIGGLLFGDFYHVSSHHTEAGDGAAGAVLRRAYLTFGAEFGEHWFGRMRFETNQSGAFETYTFETDFKDLYLGRNIGEHELIMGLSPTLTFDFVESIWKKRYLMRTPLDLQGVPSRDTGIALRGPFGSSGNWSYRAMVGAGLEFGNESGDGRKWMSAVNWRPAPGWAIDFYVDYEKLSGPRDRTTGQVFAAYQGEGWTAAALYSNQDREEEPPLELASAFVLKNLGEHVQLIGRVDRLIEPSPKGDDISYLPMDGSAPATLLLLGLEYRLNDHFMITPNLVNIRYDRNEQGLRPEEDLHLRLTLFLDFE